MLPLLIGDLVPEDNIYWRNFLLMRITGLLMGPQVTSATAVYLRHLIEEHHTAFRQLYPNRPLPPKARVTLRLVTSKKVCRF